MTYSKSIRKLLACIMAVMIAMAYMPAAAQGAYAAEGDPGTTENTPIVISNQDDLIDFLDYVNGVPGVPGGDTEGLYYALDNDIILEGVDEAWVGIGTADNPFKGNFNGNEHTIGGLNFQGLFGYVDGATISNVIIDGDIKASEGPLAGVAAVASGNTTITCVGNYADIETTGDSNASDVGGIVGCVDSRVDDEQESTEVKINQCFNKGDIKGREFVGGIVGHNDSGTLNVVSSYNNGTAKSTTTARKNSYAGGICGNACKVANCYNTGKISDAEVETWQHKGLARAITGGGPQTAAPVVESECYWLEGTSGAAPNQGSGGGSVADIIKCSEEDFTDGTVLEALDGNCEITWVPGSMVVVPEWADPQVYPGLAWEAKLDDVKEYAKSKLDRYVYPGDYGEAQQTVLADVIAEGKDDIDDPDTDDLMTVNAIIADTEEAINDIPTLEEINEAIENINYYASDVRGWYREVQWDEVQEVIAIAEEAFKAAISDQELDEAYENAVVAINAIPTDEEMKEAEAAKKALRQAVIYAKEIIGAGEYTKDTITDVKDALDYADEIMKEEEAFAWEVEDAINAVYDALYDLVPIDKNAEKEEEEFEKELKENIEALEALLNTLIDIYTNVNEADYTPESWAPLQKAINEAEVILSGSILPDTQDYIIAKGNLLFARKDLVKKPANTADLKDQLGQKVIEAKRDIASGIYTEDSVAAMTTAIDNAKAVIENLEATEADVIEAYTDLMIAWYDLEPVDKAAEKEINDFIAAYAALCEKLIDVKNIKKADYTAGTYANLKAAVDEANALLEDPLATSNDLTAAKIDILLAQKDLKKKSANTMKVKTKKKTVKYTAVKSKKKVVKAITVTKAKGKVTYAKTAGSSKLTVNKKNGKITVKKGTKKGTYKAKVKVKAAGNNNYKAKTKTVQVKIVVK